MSSHHALDQLLSSSRHDDNRDPEVIAFEDVYSTEKDARERKQENRERTDEGDLALALTMSMSSSEYNGGRDTALYDGDNALLENVSNAPAARSNKREAKRPINYPGTNSVLAQY